MLLKLPVWTLRFGLILAVAPFSLSAQNGTLSGRITDAEMGAPVVSAGVEVLGGGGNSTLTNGSGQFTISLAPGTYSVLISTLGYRDYREDGIRIRAGATTTLDLQLASEALQLDPISITVGRSQVGQKATEAPATIHNVTSQEITERPTVSLADHLREAPGVDVATSGLQGSNVVVRGFNNIFSGALHMLTDYRLAGVPSLRVNFMHFIPSTDEDIERIEVVLGPGAALYGPSTANGVVHILTKSPLDSQGTTVTLGGGERSVFQGAARSAFLLNDDFGFKISGQYMRGDEWNYVDATEQAGREAADSDTPACVADKIVRGLSSTDAQIACGRIGVRDFDIERWGLEARADYRFADDGTIVGTYGRNNSSGIELTGLGAGQVSDWVYEFFQARVNKGRSFAQAYYNTSDAGDSFLLGDGVALVDQSTLFVAQAQHGLTLADERETLTFGVDYFATRPDSRATIYGTYEDDDEMNEWGFYAQSETALSEQFDLVVAGRMDSHSVLPEKVWSPRAALVFKPREGQNFRFSYNRAFSAPSALNYFLDISGGVAPPPLGALGYSTRAYGSGRNGWSIQNPDGTLRGMRSPFNPGGADQLLPADVAVMWPLAIGVLQAQGEIDAATAALLGGLTPSNSDIARLLLDTGTGDVVPVASAVLPDLPSTLESYTETFELGWTGLIEDWVSITADVYYTRKNEFVSPLIVQTPLLLLDGTDIAAYLTPVVGAPTAGALAAGIAEIPLGVVSSDEVGARGADLIVSYRNVGDVDLWGADLAFEAFLNQELTLGGSYSHMSEDYFEITGGAPITLNAPKDKGSVSLTFREASSGISASGRVRFSRGFPAESAGFVGTECITGGTGGLFEEGCVDAFAIVDFTAGYKLSSTGATLQLSVNNVFDTGYRSFVGVPRIGRFAMARVRYELF